MVTKPSSINTEENTKSLPGFPSWCYHWIIGLPFVTELRDLDFFMVNCQLDIHNASKRACENITSIFLISNFIYHQIIWLINVQNEVTAVCKQKNEILPLTVLIHHISIQSLCTEFFLLEFQPVNTGSLEFLIILTLLSSKPLFQMQERKIVTSCKFWTRCSVVEKLPIKILNLFRFH